MANIYPKLSTLGARSLLREIAAVKTDLDDSRDFDSTPKRTILQRERVAIGWTRVMDSTVSALSWDVITYIYKVLHQRYIEATRIVSFTQD